MNIQEDRGIALGSLDWGGLRKQEPVSSAWGFDRGQPIDRYYIENFLKQNSRYIQGHCLEVMNRDYTCQFGKDQVIKSDILDINPDNLNATIVGDLTDPRLIPPESIDCFILTQTLSYIYDMHSALKNSFNALKRGGALLITVPTVVKYSPEPHDFWRLTHSALTKLIRDVTGNAASQISSHGNLIATIAFLQGLASKELELEELNYQDRQFPIVVTARILK